MKWTVGLRACFNLVKRDSLEGRSAFSFPWYATRPGWHRPLITRIDEVSYSPRGMDFKCVRGSSRPARHSIREKVAKACNRPAWTPSGAAAPCTNWPCNFPYVSLAKGTNFPGHDKLLFDQWDQEEKFDGPSSCDIFFKRCPSNVFLSNEGKISMENRFVIDRNEIKDYFFTTVKDFNVYTYIGSKFY